MTAEEILRAVAHYRLAVLPPTNTRVPADAAWCARGPRHLGFGPGPREAVEDALKIPNPPADEAGEDRSFLD